MISKTRLQVLVREFQVDDAIAGLREKPELLEFRDERGRNWLHLCASVDVSRKRALDPADSVRLARELLDLGLDINHPAFTEGSWQATPLWYACILSLALNQARRKVRASPSLPDKPA